MPEKLKQVLIFKMPFQTKHFNKNQTVFVLQLTGSEAAKVLGKYRGKYKYIATWIKWHKKELKNPEFKLIKIDKNFQKRKKIPEYIKYGEGFIIKGIEKYYA